MVAQSDTQIHDLQLDPDRALFLGELDGIVAVIFVNERPLAGLAGLLDWRFQGAISDFLRAGAISGEEGECAYLPIRRNDRTYHVLLAGAGRNASSGERKPLPSETFQVIRKNLASLRLPKMGISRSDCGSAANEHLSRQMKGVPVWILP